MGQVTTFRIRDGKGYAQLNTELALQESFGFDDPALDRGNKAAEPSTEKAIGELGVVGLAHTHPVLRARPSKQDIRKSIQLAQIYSPDSRFHTVVGSPRVFGNGHRVTVVRASVAEDGQTRVAVLRGNTERGTLRVRRIMTPEQAIRWAAARE